MSSLFEFSLVIFPYSFATSFGVSDDSNLCSVFPTICGITYQYPNLHCICCL
ncbi:hypothetical protein GLYMA_13G073700v4 [Glycine max]|nr:hypothetical protein GLYMA_13G073700v4 [Glycine max]KAH1100262.1 hypothetical protein GYH30_035428 [Glycine max]